MKASFASKWASKQTGAAMGMEKEEGFKGPYSPLKSWRQTLLLLLIIFFCVSLKHCVFQFSLAPWIAKTSLFRKKNRKSIGKQYLQPHFPSRECNSSVLPLTRHFGVERTEGERKRFGYKKGRVPICIITWHWSVPDLLIENLKFYLKLDAGERRVPADSKFVRLGVSKG